MAPTCNHMHEYSINAFRRRPLNSRKRKSGKCCLVQETSTPMLVLTAYDSSEEIDTTLFHQPHTNSLFFCCVVVGCVRILHIVDLAI